MDQKKRRKVKIATSLGPISQEELREIVPEYVARQIIGRVNSYKRRVKSGGRIAHNGNPTTCRCLKCWIAKGGKADDKERFLKC